MGPLPTQVLEYQSNLRARLGRDGTLHSACRFTISSPPVGLTGTEKMLRIVTEQEDTRSPSGGVRNELVEPVEFSGTTKVSDGDNRYYRFEVFIPTDFPAPAAGVSSWHVIFQFHEQGQCSVTAPVLTFGFNPGSDGKYRWLLRSKETYSADDSVELWRSAGEIERGQWVSFVMHVKWSRTQCSVTSCATAPFLNPDGGVIELWKNGTRVFPMTDLSLARRITMYSWPPDSDPLYSETAPKAECQNCFNGASACPDNIAIRSVGAAMQTYWKSGNYRDRNIQADEVMYFKGYRTGTTCRSVSATVCP